MNVALASRGSAANAGGGISEPRPTRGAFVSLLSCRLAAVTAASLIAHGFLIAAVLREASPDVAAPVRIIPVEVVMQPPAPENQRVADRAKDNSKRPPEAMQILPERTGDLEQKPAAPLGLDSVAERAARDLEPAKEKLPHAESQMKTPVADRFRAVAVPLPSESSGEPMSYQFIVGGMLERVKHYPVRALQRGAKGTATIGFVLDGSGGVASVVLLRSSGEAELDAESAALVRRAAPFPAAPPGGQHSFTVEVAFGMGN
jgi:TonB family protein